MKKQTLDITEISPVEFMLEKLNITKFKELNDIQLRLIARGFSTGYSIGKSEAETESNKKMRKLREDYEEKVSKSMEIIRSAIGKSNFDWLEEGGIKYGR